MTNLTTKFAAFVCTVLVSATCVLGAVGPAEPGAGKATVAMAARLTA